MNIHHRPTINVEKVVQLYSEKDGVPVKYICTSALDSQNWAMNIFYRETPHPEFGNRYFGLFYVDRYSTGEELRICNADKVENLTFEMVEVNDQWHYSQHRHDFYSVGDVTIDGGRAYLKLMGNINVPRATMKVVDGQFVMENVNEQHVEMG